MSSVVEVAWIPAERKIDVKAPFGFGDRWTHVIGQLWFICVEKQEEKPHCKSVKKEG